MGALVYSAMAKGLGDLGNIIGGGIQKNAEFQFKALESELADQRAMQRAEALERLKEQMVEERAQKDAAKAIDVEARAIKIGEERTGRAFNKLAESSALAGEQGDVPLSKEQLQEAVKHNPELGKQYQQMGLIEADQPLTRTQQRMQGAEDTIQAARELGASSTLLKSYQDSKRAVLDEIKAENKEASDKAERELMHRRLDQGDRRLDQSESRSNAQLRIMQQNADANTARANRPPAEGKGSNQERLTTMINSANQTIKSLNESSKGKTPEEKAEWDRQMSDAKRLRDNAQKQLNRLFDEDGAPQKPKAGDNSNVKSGPGTFPEPKSRADLNSLQPGTRYKAPDGTIRIKS